MENTHTEIIAKGKHLNFVSRNDWEFVARSYSTGVAVILAVTDDRKLLLVEQYRHPVQAPVLDLPAGLVGDNHGAEHEDLETAAQRELFEETGYTAEHFEPLYKAASCPGIVDEVSVMLRATGLKKEGKGGGDETEDITVHEVPLDFVMDWLNEKQESGVLLDHKIFSGLYFIDK